MASKISILINVLRLLCKDDKESQINKISFENGTLTLEYMPGINEKHPESVITKPILKKITTEMCKTTIPEIKNIIIV